MDVAPNPAARRGLPFLGRSGFLPLVSGLVLGGVLLGTPGLRNAWTWSAERKKQYANYLTYEKHLLAVSASENRKKGDKGPDRYMPPNAAYHCEYVKVWTQIKRDWELEMTEAEGETVQQILDSCN